MKNSRAVLLLCSILLAGGSVAAAESDPKGEKDVLATLETLFAAYPKRDLATLERIYHDDLNFGHTSGLVETKADVLNDIMQRRFYEFVNITSSTVRITGPVAVVRAVMDIRNGPTPDKVQTQLNRTALLVLLKGPNGWQVIARQATPPKE